MHKKGGFGGRENGCGLGEYYQKGRGKGGKSGLKQGFLVNVLYYIYLTGDIIYVIMRACYNLYARERDENGESKGEVS